MPSFLAIGVKWSTNDSKNLPISTEFSLGISKARIRKTGLLSISSTLKTKVDPINSGLFDSGLAINLYGTRSGYYLSSG